MKFKFELHAILVIHPRKAIAIRSDTEFLLEFVDKGGELHVPPLSIKAKADYGRILSPRHDGQPQSWILNTAFDGCPFYSPLDICDKTAVLYVKDEHHFAHVLGRTELIEYVIEFPN